MILVFFILCFIIIISLINLILVLSNVKLKIKNLHIFAIEEKIKMEFEINISIYFLNKLKIFNIKIGKNKLINKFKLESISKKNNRILKLILKLEYAIEYLKIEGYFGTFNSMLSSNLYVCIHSIIPILILNKLSGEYINNLNFLKLNQNTINVNLSCIINTKIVNIINILQLNKKLKNTKKGGDKNYGRTSNRRVNAYSNE